MVAGEASGDLLAGLLLDGMRARWPALAAQGIGGPQMRARGFEAWWPHEKLAVRGYVEVLRHYREIVGIRNQLRERLLADPPDAFIGVDAPDFNLDLEAALQGARHPDRPLRLPLDLGLAARARGEDPPQLRPRAVHLPVRAGAAGQARHRRHLRRPSAGQRDPDGARPGRGRARALGLERGRRRSSPCCRAAARSEVQIPGRRASSRRRRLLQRGRPGIRFVVPAVPGLRARDRGGGPRRRARRTASRCSTASRTPALAACDLTLIASGTATLEAALFKRPMVIAYNMNWLT